jgi:alkylhydroperoxidase family enzyme
MSTERMPNPATLIPEALFPEALAAVDRVIAGAGIDGRLLALTRLRVSQINGSGPGVADGVHRAARAGATTEQVHAVAAFRETPWFSDEERAALALTEAVTRLADRADPVPDQVWDQNELAALLLTIAVGNAVDRLDRATRRQPQRGSLR